MWFGCNENHFPEVLAKRGASGSIGQLAVLQHSLDVGRESSSQVRLGAPWAGVQSAVDEGEQHRIAAARSTRMQRSVHGPRSARLEEAELVVRPLGEGAIGPIASWPVALLRLLYVGPGAEDQSGRISPCRVEARSRWPCDALV